MTVLHLHDLAGVYPESMKEQQAAIPQLTAYALQMREAGVVLTVEFWAAQDVYERVALTAAGRQYDVKQAIRVGQAAQGGFNLLRVQAEVDGGMAHDHALLEEAVKTVAEAAAEDG